MIFFGILLLFTSHALAGCSLVDLQSRSSARDDSTVSDEKCLSSSFARDQSDIALFPMELNLSMNKHKFCVEAARAEIVKNMRRRSRNSTEKRV